jgi:ankyrin repeat protein
MMPLLKLPNEILLQIARQIDSVRDLYHLTLVNRLLNDLVEPEIYRCEERHEARENYGIELLRYAENGDQSGILEMLSLGADINFYSPDRVYNLKPAIHAAIELKNIEFLKFLLDNSALPNLPFEHRYYGRCPPLMDAIKQSASDGLAMMTLLLDYGANPNVRDYLQFTPLIMAISTGHFGKVKLLIARGADVNAPCKGESALHAAIRKSSFCTVHGMHCNVKALIEAGSEMDCVDDHNISPLMQAVCGQAGRESADSLILTEMLLNAGAHIHFTGPDGRNAFLRAARCGSEATLRLLRDRGADMHSVSFDGRNAVQAAAAGGNMANLQCLSDWGVNMHFRSPDGRNALYDAISAYENFPHDEAKTIQILTFLLERGLNVDSRDRNQQTPLLFLLSSRPFNPTFPRLYYTTLDLLIGHGANINAQDNQGATALHYAARQDESDLVKWLYSRKAGVNECDHNGETPIFWAMRNVEIYDKHVKLPATIQTLLDLGADDHIANLHGQTPLCLAAHAWCPQSVAVFIQRGGDVHHRDNDGRTPLHWFAASEETPTSKHSLEVIEMLLAEGADVNARTSSGATPLSILRKKHPTRHIRKMLIDAGGTE